MEIIAEGERDEDEDEEDNNDEEEPHANGLGNMIKKCWEKREEKLYSDYAWTGRILSVDPDVREDVRLRPLDGTQRDAIERVIEKLHMPLCPNKHKWIKGKSTSKIIDRFWDKYQQFDTKREPFDKAGRWLTDDCLKGRSHKWHYKYSEPYTVVLGFVACRVTSKVLGIGMAERAWGALKIIKDGRRAHLSGESTEMRSIVYTSARLEQQRIVREEAEKIDKESENNMFGDDDLM